MRQVRLQPGAAVSRAALPEFGLAAGRGLSGSAGAGVFSEILGRFDVTESRRMGCFASFGSQIRLFVLLAFLPVGA